MAVAVKNNRETSSSTLFDRLSVNIVLGIVYVLGSLGILFPLLSTVWWQWLGLDRNSVLSWLLVLIVDAAVAVALVVLGRNLLGRNPAKGLRAGVALGALGVLLLALLTQWIGQVVEGWLFTSSTFSGASPIIGVVMTIGLGVLLLVVGGRYFLGPETEKHLVEIEEQGWFSWTSYKRSQGQRVRRGTTLGFLILAGCGIWVLHRTLAKDEGGWYVNVPFTGQVYIDRDHMGDNPILRQEWQQELEALRSREQPGQEVALEPILVRDRFELRDLNRQFEQQYVKIQNPGSDLARIELPDLPYKSDFNFTENQVVPRSVFEQARDNRTQRHAKLVDAKRTFDAELVQPPTDEKVSPATGEVEYKTLTLLPHMKYTVPLLLALLTLWVGWRGVNVPMFADFLIATEAELNKVSWTTRKRLYQDTIVVLTTVVLMAVFLLAADFVWSWTLTRLGVLQPPPAAAEKEDVSW
jgi:preprotein translocase SecE subunit